MSAVEMGSGVEMASHGRQIEQQFKQQFEAEREQLAESTRRWGSQH